MIAGGLQFSSFIVFIQFSFTLFSVLLLVFVNEYYSFSFDF